MTSKHTKAGRKARLRRWAVLSDRACARGIAAVTAELTPAVQRVATTGTGESVRVAAGEYLPHAALVAAIRTATRGTSVRGDVVLVSGRGSYRVVKLSPGTDARVMGER